MSWSKGPDRRLQIGERSRGTGAPDIIVTARLSQRPHHAIERVLGHAQTTDRERRSASFSLHRRD
jgi:hypothetical protein